MTTTTELLELLSLDFVQRAAATGALTAIACALLGVFLLPRRFAMIGDGLAHFALAAVGLALLIRCTPTWVLLPAMVIAALLVLRLPLRSHFYGDALIGILSVSGLALGVLLASLRGGFNVDLFSYLFGDILTVSSSEFAAAAVLSSLGILIVVVLFRELVAVTADPEHAHVLGIRAGRIDRLLAVLTALTVAVGLRTAGALLISSFLILPPTAALQVARSFQTTAVLAAVFGLSAALIGLAVALVWNLPAAPAMALANLGILLSVLTARRFRPN